MKCIKINIPVSSGDKVNTEILQGQIEAVQPEGITIGVGVKSDEAGNAQVISLDIPEGMDSLAFENVVRDHILMRPKSDKEVFDERPKPADLISRVSSLESQLEIIKAHLGLK